MSTIPQSNPPVHIGVDIAKASFQADLLGKSRNFPNTAKGHRDFASKLPQGAFIVMEATGSYHLALLRHLQSLEIPAAVVNPARVRAFAKAIGIMAKTDPVDACLLSRFGAATQPPAAMAADPDRVALKELCTVRDALLAESINWTNLIEHHQTKEARRFAEARLAQVKRDLAKVEKRIAVLLEASRELSSAASVLLGCKGIGPVTTAILLSSMPELGHLNRSEAGSLAGLAPYANDSGSHNGKRRIRAGRPRVKRALYLAALSAVRHHPTLRPYYKALRERGKPAKVALVAVARKLLSILNARLKEFYQSHQQENAVGPVASVGAMTSAENGLNNSSEAERHGDPSP